jgi:inosine-uridine nucleoside N-ribohydrolase
MQNLIQLLLVCALAVTSLFGASKVPIILDTDMGSDIDDAFTLALIINSPELELGVTTVSGDTQARARLAARLLWEAGGAWRKVPVYAAQPESLSPLSKPAGPRASPVPACI